MKTCPQSSSDRAHVAALIENIPIAMLTHMAADGTLTSRPMAVLEMDAHGALWFFVDARSSSVVPVPAANLSFADTARATYVSLSGRGEIHADHERIQRLWTTAAKPWFPDGPDSPTLTLLKFVPDSADYWDGPNSKMVRAMGLFASVVVGKPLAIGEQGSHADLSGTASKEGPA